MSSFPDQEPGHPQDESDYHASEPAVSKPENDSPSPLELQSGLTNEPPTSALDPDQAWKTELSPPGPHPIEPPLFQLQPLPPVRIPHLGHLFFLLFALLPMGLLATGLLLALALHERLYGVSTAQHAVANIHYILGSEAILYLVTFVAALFIFPVFWHKGFFAGLQWNAATAFRLRWRLASAAMICFLLAVLNGELLPGPTNTPIEKVFRAPGAAWLLFAFGVTFAPFFEETLFRGFLLPSLCTAYDWLVERFTGKPLLPLGPKGHPQWSLPAMVVGSIATSIPFAWMHAEQTGYAFGPLLLLVGVSIVLCAVRLATRSLAASVVVHACYNFLLFSLMLVASSGFRHLDKM